MKIALCVHRKAITVRFVFVGAFFITTIYTCTNAIGCGMGAKREKEEKLI
jgi:hypothetical protein